MKLRVEPLQLPKGGGAITGLPNGFAPDEFAGAARVNIPFEVPQARGLAPLLTVTYASGGGNGVFGVGFALNVSSIGRKTNKGIPRYGLGDQFSLDGGPALVRSADAPQQRKIGERSYVVSVYRPRSFAQHKRIEQWAATDGADSFWRTIDAENRLTLYGRTPGARVADPDDPSHVFEWLVEWESDSRGNAVSYAYKQENTDGLAGHRSALNRVFGANRHLERIRYGNAAPIAATAIGIDDPAALTWHFEIVADYGEYDLSTGNDTPYVPARQWPARQDPFSTFEAGFERRTARLCRSLLLFHRFPAELGDAPVLVRSLTFQYDENPVLTRLVGATSTGYRLSADRPAGQRYRSRSFPPLQLGYAAYTPDAARFVPIEQTDGSWLPGIDGPPAYSFVDLYGEGAPGILYADGTSTFYRPPRAANSDSPGTLSYDRPRECPQFAIQRRASGQDLALLDLDGDGRMELEVVASNKAGSHKVFADGTWSPFKPFESVATEYHSPFAEHFDLTGDGTLDVVIVGTGGVRYYPARGEAGYGAPVDQPAAQVGADAPPPATPLNPHMLVRFGDLCGAGRQRVRIENGRVTCWPSLGYGRFGPPVDLGSAPLLGAEFDARRVFLADLDGSGVSDIVYAESEQLLIYANQSGNGFASEPLVVPLPARCCYPDQIKIADARGNGWDCVIFTEDLTQPRQWLLDLCGGAKPYMLNRVSNSLGVETRIEYASSTRFGLADRDAGRRWLTALAAPTQVVSRVEEYERVSGQCKITEYAYRNGAYDGIERQFRGFGMIERRETEPLPDPAPGVASPASTRVTRVWYHTGLMEADEEAADQAYADDTAAYGMPGTLYEWSQGFVPDPETLRQARVAMAGNALREEVYGLDGAATQGVPYSIAQNRYRVRLLQPTGASDAVFLVGEAESIHYNYERDRDDPRVSHAYTLAVDDDGIVGRSVALNYPRRDRQASADTQQGEPPLQDAQQRELRAVCTMLVPVPRRDEADILLFGLPQDERIFALSGLPAPDSSLYFSFAQMTGLAAAALATNPVNAAPTAALLSRTRHLWIAEGNGTIAPQALALRSDEAVFTPAAIATAMDGVPAPGGLDTFLRESGGYVEDDGLWWQPGPQASYGAAEHFYRLASTQDVFAQRKAGRSGTIVTCTYDPYDLLVTAVTTSGRDNDVQSHRVDATFLDYQSLTAVQMTDSNGLVTEALIDALGLVIATSKRGQEWNGTAAVPVGFAPLPLHDPSSWPVPPSAAALLADPAKYLGGAEAIFLAAFPDENTPAPSAEIGIYATSYPTAAAPNVANGIVDVTVNWTDGRARNVQTSELAAPDQWRITGRNILLQSDQPWRQFLPVYAATADFLGAATLPTLKPAVTHFYDPLDRPVRSAVARGDLWEAFFSTSRYSAWDITEADLDDTVKDSAWYKRHVDPGDPNVSPLPQPEKDALIQAARFHGTPSTTVLGSNGYPVRQIARLTTNDADALVTRHRLDLAGRVQAEADPRLGAAGQWNTQRVLCLTGQVLADISADAGKTCGLVDARGDAILSYDALGYLALTAYDSFGRVNAITLRTADGKTRTVERIIYGDSLDGAGQPPVAAAASRNLVGQIVRHYDPAGCIDISAYGICDQPLGVARSFLADYAADADWTYNESAGWMFAAEEAALAAALDSERFTVTRRYDALGRPTEETDPAGNGTVIAFGHSGQITSLSATPRGEQSFTYLDSIVYDPDGKRSAERVVGPSGPVIARTFTYDGDNRRLIGISSIRCGDSATVQALSYVYDPVGNITHVDDPAAPSANVVRNGQVVTPVRDYTYDALYRLTGATGRAHTALTKDNESSGRYDAFFGGDGSLNDPTAIYRYAVTYEYDTGNNLWQTRFVAPPGQSAARWTRTLTVDATSNRAVDSDTAAGRAISTFFDATGNQTQVAGLPMLIWDYRSRLREIVIVDRGNSANPDAQFLAHDGSGQRVRKTTQRLVGGGSLRIEETFYFGGLEITRTRQNGSVVEERQRLRLMDQESCIAERLSWTVGTPSAGVTGPQLRVQIEDRQGSSNLELDERGSLVSHEEYAPYGTTVYASGPSLAQVSLKRYRFSRKERDQDTGLSDYGARHYAPWLGRWLSCDPAGPVDGLNLYAFVAGNPVTWEDVGGLGKRTKNASVAPKRKSKNRIAVSVPGNRTVNVKVKPGRGTAFQRRQARRANLGERQSPRIEAKRAVINAQFAAPAGVAGYHYWGWEHVNYNGLQPKFGSVTMLRDDIRGKLHADINNFSQSGAALSDLPEWANTVVTYAANNWKNGDFLEPTTETINFFGQKYVRTKASAGTIVPRDGSGAKVGASDPYNGIDTSIDDRGHLVPEKGVSDTQSTKVNGPSNVVAENWVINQRYKTAFEQGVKEFAVNHPKMHVMTIHVPHYAPLGTRPTRISHFMAINGTVVSAFTFNNANHVIEARG